MFLPERARGARLGLQIALSGIGFALIAPIGVLTLPLAGLLLLWHGRSARAAAVGAVATGISVWWIAQLGDPPDQMVRAAAVMATTTFLGLPRTGVSLPHRGVVSVAAAAAGGVALAAALGRSWGEIHWWVAHRIGFTARLVLTQMWAAVPVGANGLAAGGDDRTVVQMERLLDEIVPLMADLFPALTALQMLMAFALATYLAGRVLAPHGPSLGPFREFRFSEHLGWVAVLSLVILLTGVLPAGRLAAVNVLSVAGTLYALRGAAVVWSGLTARGSVSFLTVTLVVFSVLFVLPVVLAIVIVLGVVDTGTDLRKRWTILPRD